MKKSFVVTVDEERIKEHFHPDIVEPLGAMEVDEDVELTDGTTIARTE